MYITALDNHFKVIKSVKAPNRVKASDLLKTIEGAHAFVWTVKKQKKGTEIKITSQGSV